MTIDEFLINFGFNSEDIRRIKEQFIFSKLDDEKKMKHLKDITTFLKEYGYNKGDILSITRRFYAIFSYTSDNIKEKFAELKDLNFDDNTIKKLFKFAPSICGLKKGTIYNKIDDLKLLGYTYDEVLKMIKDNASLINYKVLKKDDDDKKGLSVKEKIDGFISLGYTHGEVHKMTVNYSQLFNYDIETIRTKIENISKFGYTYDEVLFMIKMFPVLISYSIQNMNQKLSDLMELGFSMEEVLRMTSLVPVLFGYGIDNIKSKVEFLRRIDLGSIIVQDPGKLITSVKVVYARYRFLTSNGIDVSVGSHGKLFYQEKAFKKQFGISKKELLEIYPYEEERLLA